MMYTSKIVGRKQGAKAKYAPIMLTYGYFSCNADNVAKVVEADYFSMLPILGRAHGGLNIFVGSRAPISRLCVKPEENSFPESMRNDEEAKAVNISKPGHDAGKDSRANARL
jgi:hypothetical protein